MHGPEKSDSVVVAAKLTNKAERSAAEPAEPRTGTKGNVDQQSTRRAQDRESVSQALDRVRTYERDLDRKIEDLHVRVKSGAYRALPSRRSYIPKEAPARGCGPRRQNRPEGHGGGAKRDP